MNLRLLLFAFLLIWGSAASAQTLSLRDAVTQGVSQYGIVNAKSKYAAAAAQTVSQTRREYLPNLTLAAQQDYGTVNGQNGPLYGFGGYGVGSSGLALEHQNWNAAFGALYLVNVNWDFFTFGRTRQRIQVAKADEDRLKKDAGQEIFQHRVRISAAYLNLLASQRLVISQRKNLARSEVFLNQAAVRVKNGLLPGVDSTLASAEVSRARIALNQALDQVKDQNNRLVTLLGGEIRDFVLDSNFVSSIPKAFVRNEPVADSLNPILQFYRSRVALSREQVRLYKKEYLPTFSFFGIFQTRASGFDPAYNTDQTAYTQNYWDGVNPSRQNYLLGVGVSWNLTGILRGSKKVAAQKLVSEGLQDEYRQMEQQLASQADAAEAKIRYALANYQEAPRQVRAAQQAYLQKTTLYKNGLTTLVDVTQALYALNRAETDRDVAYVNVWQALLLKAASTGDFDLFFNEF